MRTPGDLQRLDARDPANFRTLARRWAASVTVVTVRGAIDPHPDDGFTATAFLTISMAPPIILVSATNTTSAMPMLRDARAFAVNLLADTQRDLADAFAQPAAARGDLWNRLEFSRDDHGAALIHGSLGAFSATVRALHDAGDHTLVLGDVTALHAGPASEALVYRDRTYGRFTPSR